MSGLFLCFPQSLETAFESTSLKIPFSLWVHLIYRGHVFLSWRRSKRNSHKYVVFPKIRKHLCVKKTLLKITESSPYDLCYKQCYRGCNLHTFIHSVKFSDVSINIYILKGANPSDLLCSTGACSIQQPCSVLEKKSVPIYSAGWALEFSSHIWLNRAWKCQDILWHCRTGGHK